MLHSVTAFGHKGFTFGKVLPEFTFLCITHESFVKLCLLKVIPGKNCLCGLQISVYTGKN